MKGLLASASKQGAVYVTHLSIHMVRTLPNGYEDCATLVYPVRTDISDERRIMEPGRPQSHSVLKPVTRWVYTSSVPRTRMVPRTRTGQQCRSEPLSRMETRYEYQFEQDDIPPRWHVISQTHSEWQLEASAPSCMVAPPGEAPQNRVEAILYWEPVASP